MSACSAGKRWCGGGEVWLGRCSDALGDHGNESYDSRRCENLSGGGVDKRRVIQYLLDGEAVAIIVSGVDNDTGGGGCASRRVVMDGVNWRAYIG